MSALHADQTAPWNGDYESENRAPKPSTSTVLADVVGDALGVGDGTLLPLGSVFEIVDLAAGTFQSQQEVVIIRQNFLTAR